MIVAGLVLAALAVVAAIGWALLLLFAMSIGSPGPSAWQVILPLLPGFLAVALAGATLIAAIRRLRAWTLAGGLAALLVLPAAALVLVR